MKKDKFQNLVLWVVRKKAPDPCSSQFTKEVKINWKALPAIVVILLACLASTAYAVPLTGSGSNLPHTPLGAPPFALRDIISENLDVDFTGEWTAPALPDWLGTFDARGPVPASTTRSAGMTTYDDFTGLALGYLPAGTMFLFGDVDSGSATTETFGLHAWDIFGSLITTAWLDEPIGVWGSGSGPGGDPAMNDMPGWTFNTGEYFIDGSTVSGNPNIAFMLQSNVAISELTVSRNSQWANFSLAAPIPEPATICLLGLGGLLLRRKKSA